MVLLGSGVARDFGLPARTEPLRWASLGRHEAAVCPHPSGVNTWWNDPYNVGGARSFWLRLTNDATATFENSFGDSKC